MRSHISATRSTDSFKLSDGASVFQDPHQQLGTTASLAKVLLATLLGLNPESYLLLANSDNKEDGQLEAWEVMNLDLHGDLAVLSACETARGRAESGEGVIGRSWALFVAGVPTTVVSQRKVEAASTKELMIESHRSLIKNRAQHSLLHTAEALRQAQRNLLKK